MKVAVVNCSKGFYNLGAEKLYAWQKAQGVDADYFEGDPGFFLDHDRVYLSVIFSWDAPVAVEMARRVLARAHVEAGGPGLYALANWWTRETGLQVQRGLDPRFERQAGNYRAVFASRGCPTNCSFCIVSKIEGTAQVLDWDFEPAPWLYDNNLSALPVEFQEHIVRRYLETGTTLADANSGFEPKYFDADTYRRWQPLFGKSVTWRFAYDETGEGEQVERMAGILKDVLQRRKRVYVLAGNEPLEACYERAQKVLEWNCTPYVQPVMSLNALRRDDLIVRYDWTLEKLKAFQQYYNGFRWYSVPISEYVSATGRHFERLNHYQPYVVTHPRQRRKMDS